MVKEWPIVPIRELLEFKNGLNKGKEYFGYGTPIVNYTDVYHNTGLMAKDIKGKVCLSKDEIRRFEVRKNDVFFTRTSETPEEVGLSAVLLEDIDDCVFSGFVLRGRPKTDDLVGDYCKYCFSTKHVREEIVRNCTYTTRALTNGRVLSSIDIPVPSKPEQEEIANILTGFEEHIDDLGELIEKKRGIRDGALHDLISGKTFLKDFSGSRNRVSLSQCVDIFQGGTPRTSNDAYWDGNIVWVTPTEITALDGMYIGESKRKITEEGLNNSSANLLPVGTILLCTRATIGELAISTVPLTTNQGFKNLVCKKGYHNVYFAYLLMTLKDEMISRAIGTTFLEISKKELGEIEIKIPEYDEQKAIADVLSSMDREIGALNAEREKMLQIREGAMDDLLTGRIRLTK